LTAFFYLINFKEVANSARYSIGISSMLSRGDPTDGCILKLYSAYFYIELFTRKGTDEIKKHDFEITDFFSAVLL